MLPEGHERGRAGTGTRWLGTLLAKGPSAALGATAEMQELQPHSCPFPQEWRLEARVQEGPSGVVCKSKS